MYIMCVILCLFNALSRRIGALQMSIIIIIILNELREEEEDDETQRRSVTRKMRTTTTAQSILKLKRFCSTVLHRPWRDVWLRVTLTRVRHSSRKSSATHSYRCMQYSPVSRQWYGCQRLGFLTCSQMSMTAIADVGSRDTVRESALQVDSGRKLPGRTGDSNHLQYCE